MRTPLLPDDAPAFVADETRIVTAYRPCGGEHVGQLRRRAETSVVKVQVRDHGVTVARLPDVVTFDTVTALQPDITALLDERNCRHLVLDLSRIDFFDSSGLSMLLKVWRRCLATGTAFTLAAPPPFISDMLEITQIGRVLAVAPSVQQALRIHHQAAGNGDPLMADHA
ncbi:STAS domain-containing protein [Streptomyces sp. NPDC054838]